MGLWMQSMNVQFPSKGKTQNNPMSLKNASKLNLFQYGTNTYTTETAPIISVVMNHLIINHGQPFQAYSLAKGLKKLWQTRLRDSTQRGETVVLEQYLNQSISETLLKQK
jgi:hypothetical protein